MPLFISLLVFHIFSPFFTFLGILGLLGYMCRGSDISLTDSFFFTNSRPYFGRGWQPSMWSIFRISSLFDIYLRVFFASISDELTSIIRSYEVNHRVLDTVLYNYLSPPT